MTAETIKKTFISGDAERRCFFAVKGAAGPEIPSLALQGHVPRYDADDVIGLPHLFNEFTGKSPHANHLYL